MTIDLKLPDAEATGRLGAALAAGMVPGRVLYLSGELGSGKTTLVRGLLRALNVTGPIKSPTYAWVEPYSISSLDLYHFDFYRFADRNAWLSSGLREYFRPDAACIVEWPERAGELLPPPDLAVRLSYDDTGRRAELRSHSAAGDGWLSSLRQARSSS
ncbi:MAG TPA: tRNA (adenosine(37)-N6)-threonylcarbamoyltransferase complex ATPase subunit type 1 TsaE [Burkholderiales bacterium]|nr:tRNA (adenosine(37)-N6)-threonylcarbamoyltransferase complex ATPase subunit type 1 TsaE [Burkholderiales bacterium]